ncbi:MAG: hypothetical protein QW476_00685 [Candidatus Bathyarchaeia archaeon]|nr:hypothetical protein [Candidatus Bathyarchaeota archaeon]
MGLKERLAKANWELNYFFRTGRLPRYEHQTQPSSSFNHQIQCTQFNGSQGVSTIGNEYTLCNSCKNYIPKNANYCDKCGKKLR